MKKTDNRGLSLIELLIAVCILAILAVPLLHSFVTSYRVNAIGRTTLRATTLAQNEMEIFEREKISDLVEKQSEFGYTAVIEPADNPTDPGIYKFEKIGTINDDSERSMFDVYVELNPLRQTGEKYESKNTAEIMTLNTLSVLDSGIYAQKARTERNKKSDDEKVYATYAEYAKTNGHADKKADYYENKLERTITLDIKQENDAEGKAVTKATVTCLYHCPDDTVPSTQADYPVVSEIFDNTDSINEEGERVELKSLYLFYTPRYDTTNEDIIIINNAENLPVNVYIIRQDIWQKDADIVRDVPSTYAPTVEITDTLDAEGRCAGTYYTNMRLDVADGDTNNGAQVNLTINGSIPGVPVGITRAEQLENMGCMKIGTTHTKDRIYDILVTVYKNGAVPGTDSPLAKLTGTKLE